MKEITSIHNAGVSIIALEDGGVPIYEVKIPDGSSFCYTEGELRALFGMADIFPSVVDRAERYISVNVLGIEE